MASKVEGTVPYLKLVDYTLDAANQSEELKDMPPR